MPVRSFVDSDASQLCCNNLGSSRYRGGPKGSHAKNTRLVLGRVWKVRFLNKRLRMGGKPLAF